MSFRNGDQYPAAFGVRGSHIFQGDQFAVEVVGTGKNSEIGGEIARG